MALKYLPPDKAFLDPDRKDAAHPQDARCVVIPFGLEKTVSYGRGTAAGPEAILRASHQLELYDDEFARQPCDQFGIATLVPPKIGEHKSLEQSLSDLSDRVGTVIDQNRFPLVLGGEHALTAGAIRPFAKQFEDLVVVQFDAHADLRDGYLGEHYSHASAMRRVLDHDNISLISIGIRAISQAEVSFYEDNRSRVQIHWAKNQDHWNIDEIVAPIANRPTYITFDIDALDSAAMPATGTPTPGGLSYGQSLSI